MWADRYKPPTADFPKDRAKDTTHRALVPFLIFGKIAGILPVRNSTNYSAGANSMSFKWLSIRTIYAGALICFSLVALSLTFRRLIKVGISLGWFTAICFYSSTTCTAILMFRFAAGGHWKRLMVQFEETELIFTEERSYPTPKWSLRRKIGTLTGILVTICVVEHMFYLMAKMTNVWSQIQKCNLNIFFYEHFLRTERRHIYAVIPFSYFIAIPFEITNMSMTAAWTFLDMFIMIYSIALAHRFQQISTRIKGVISQRMPDAFWCEVREHFVLLQELVGSVDDLFSYPILLSCGTDVYFTCYLLYSSFGSFPERLNALYFSYSISFIIVRTFLTLYFATTVYEAARRPRILLKSIPHYAWGPEVDRLAYQLSGERVALSAKQFFYFTRNVMLTLLGTIITYELFVMDHILEQAEVVQQTCEVVYNVSQNN